MVERDVVVAAVVEEGLSLKLFISLRSFASIEVGRVGWKFQVLVKLVVGKFFLSDHFWFAQ